MSLTDTINTLGGKVLDTITAREIAKASKSTPPPAAPTDQPRVTAAPAASAPVAPAAPFPQWQLWISGTIAIGAVISLGLLALRRAAPKAA